MQYLLLVFPKYKSQLLELFTGFQAIIILDEDDKAYGSSTVAYVTTPLYFNMDSSRLERNLSSTDLISLEKLYFFYIGPSLKFRN